jgi:hypothetical protein
MTGTPAEIVSQLATTGARHLYVDGGVTIQGFLRAGLIQRLIITRAPVLIGDGIPLFGTLAQDIFRIALLWPSGGDYVVSERPQEVEQRRDLRRTSLEAARRADAEQRPHLQTEIERTGVNEHSLEHVLVPAHMQAPESAGLVRCAHGRSSHSPRVRRSRFPRSLRIRRRFA